MSDPAFETLILPIENGDIPYTGTERVLFLRARMHPAMKLFHEGQVTCEQSFAPERDRLQAGGFTVVAETDETDFDLVFVLPGRQRQEARAELARAATLVKPGGWVVVAALNTEGAKTLVSDMAALFGSVDQLSKNKCRVIWIEETSAELDQSLKAEWAKLDAPRPILDGAWISRPGIFAWDRIDPASRLLADHLPDTLAGKGADLGCGFGFLARTVLERAPKVTALDLYEAEKRALDLARENLKAFSETKILHGLWSDVTRGLEGTYDFIVSNPPFHQSGKAGRTDVGQDFIRAAAAGLRIGGVFYMVANRHLPYEATLKETFRAVDMIADEGGYKVIRAVKGAVGGAAKGKGR